MFCSNSRYFWSYRKNEFFENHKMLNPDEGQNWRFSQYNDQTIWLSIYCSTCFFSSLSSESITKINDNLHFNLELVRVVCDWFKARGFYLQAVFLTFRSNLLNKQIRTVKFQWERETLLRETFTNFSEVFIFLQKGLLWFS